MPASGKRTKPPETCVVAKLHKRSRSPRSGGTHVATCDAPPEAETVRAAGPAQACQTPSGLSSHLPSVYDVILSASQGPRLMMQPTMGLFDPSYNGPPAHLISFFIAGDIHSLSSLVASAKGLPGCYMTAARDIRSLRVNHQKPRAVGSQSSQGNNARP